MKDYQRLNHTRWDWKYHVAFIPKRRKKAIYGAIRKHVVEIFHELARHEESEIVERHL
jgi:putative transposase